MHLLLRPRHWSVEHQYHQLQGVGDQLVKKETSHDLQ